MPLTQEQEDREHEARMDQMAVNIEKMRADMLTSQKLLAWETRKFVISIVVGAAALLGAGVALGNYFTNLHNPPAASDPQTPKL